MRCCSSGKAARQAHVSAALTCSRWSSWRFCSLLMEEVKAAGKERCRENGHCSSKRVRLRACKQAIMLAQGILVAKLRKRRGWAAAAAACCQLNRYRLPASALSPSSATTSPRSRRPTSPACSGNHKAKAACSPAPLFITIFKLLASHCLSAALSLLVTRRRQHTTLTSVHSTVYCRIAGRAAIRWSCRTVTTGRSGSRVNEHYLAMISAMVLTAAGILTSVHALGPGFSSNVM